MECVVQCTRILGEKIMTNSFADRFRNNARIQTSSSDLPEFPGMFVMANGTSGALGVGKDTKTANSIKNIEFITHFTMSRLVFQPNRDERYSTNYVVSGENIPYVLDYKGHSYIGDSLKDIRNQLGLEDHMIKYQQIFVGYAVNVNDRPAKSAQAIWYVSRGNNAYQLNNKLNEFGSLTARTLIKLSNNQTIYKNNSGGTNYVLDVDISEIAETKVDDFLKWTGNLTDKLEQYRLDMVEASKNVVQTAKEAEQKQVAMTQPGNIWMPQEQHAPQSVPSQPAQETQSAPANPFGGQQVPEQAPANPFPSGQSNNQAPADPFGSGDEIVIEDDDLPF